MPNRCVRCFSEHVTGSYTVSQSQSVPGGTQFLDFNVPVCKPCSAKLRSSDVTRIGVTTFVGLGVGLIAGALFASLTGNQELGVLAVVFVLAAGAAAYGTYLLITESTPKVAWFGWHNNQYYFPNKEFQALFDELNKKKSG